MILKTKKDDVAPIIFKSYEDEFIKPLDTFPKNLEK